MFLNQANMLQKSKKVFRFIWRKEFAYFLVIPFIIYFYFLKWKLTSIHDDDLYLYNAYADLKGFPQQSNVSMVFGQYRPVRDIFFHWLIQLFDRNFEAYYIFNIVVQSINTIIFAYLLNLLLRSMSLSFFLSLILGLSRFCFYNVTQMFDGGILEGMAMTFFLLFLFFTIKISIKPGISAAEQRKGILLSILFANLGMYTHERYIAIFPFILFMILLFPKFKGISLKHKAGLSFMVIASVILNIVLKTYVYSLKFFVGTGNTKIDFSLSSSFKSLRKAIASVLQYNIGAEWLIGFKFSNLPVFYKGLVILIICLIIGVFGLFILKAVSAFTLKKKNYPPHVAIFIFLPAIFFLTLVPCIFQERTELRWLQAPLSVLILMFAIALNGVTDKNNNRKYLFSLLLCVSFLFTNYYYVKRGSKNVYYSTSARVGNAFDKAVKDSVIHSGTSNLYILEKKKDLQREYEIKWALVDGHFFKPYHSNKKNLIFIGSDSVSSLSGFNSRHDEIIYLDITMDEQTFNYSITNITKEYLRDSLHEFTEILERPALARNVHYNQEELSVTNDSFNDFITDGFYESENGVRWTNGNATIGFIGDFTAADSLGMELGTYMPPICKNVSIRPSIIDVKGEKHLPVSSRREADNFYFYFYFKQPVKIKDILLTSDTVKAVPPDTRTLSFLFGSLKLKN
jgi:hypothetical protein